MKYFESRTYGEVLSRITNDVDTLGMGLNQSVTQIITSTATIIGVLVMMFSISPRMTLIALLILPVSLALVLVVVLAALWTKEEECHTMWEVWSSTWASHSR